MPNLIVISSIIFPCMYAGLSIRDKSERSVNNQASRVELVDFAIDSRVTHKKQPAKRPRVKHMTRR